mmetsp:Transcript_105028/g.321864  ORF Transcript_105028/g.321864 Transcript_105028/m.321864 type:complete len:208 (-) Transcript_105028:415-1038(-)
MSQCIMSPCGTPSPTVLWKWSYWSLLEGCKWCPAAHNKVIRRLARAPSRPDRLARDGDNAWVMGGPPDFKARSSSLSLRSLANHRSTIGHGSACCAAKTWGSRAFSRFTAGAYEFIDFCHSSYGRQLNTTNLAPGLTWYTGWINSSNPSKATASIRHFERAAANSSGLCFSITSLSGKRQAKGPMGFGNSLHDRPFFLRWYLSLYGP